MVLEHNAPGTMATTEVAPSTAERYHSLDFLRGVLMFLGIVFHASLPYDSYFAATLKPYPTSDILAFVSASVHAFRMPLFFVLAGFFAALLLSRRTTKGFLLNRTLRIGAPFLLFWVAFQPILAGGVIFSALCQYFTQRFAFNYAWREITGLHYFLENDLMHLWFLYYLSMFYVSFLVLAYLTRLLPEQQRHSIRMAVNGTMLSRWRLVLLAVPTVGILYLIPFASLATPLSFEPDWRFLVYYGVFFVIGSMLYSVTGSIRDFGRVAWLYVLGAFLLMLVFEVAANQWRDDGGLAEGWRALGNLAVALMIWSLFFGVTSLLLRYLNRPIGAVRYLADASYWSYLVHPLLLVWLPGLIARKDWPPEVKFLIVLITVVLFCLATYELLIRWTLIGTILQGRRYPSMLGMLARRLRVGRQVKQVSPSQSAPR